MKQLKITISIVLALIIYVNINAQNPRSSEIKWDNWGVPHISGATDADVYFAFGWAQMKAHGNIILKSYAKARGRSAEYWGGTQNLKSDQLTRKMNIPTRAQQWYDVQANDLKDVLSAFAAGMNAYCKAHGDQIDGDLKIVLPIQHTDPLAQLQVSYHLGVGAFAMQPQAAQWKTAGSNAWAIAPSRSKSGNALLLTQPHPPWFPDYLFFEAHLQSKDHNIYGIALVGSPGIAMGFNDNLGWALTFNQADTYDLIELELNGNSYLSEGKWKPLTIKEEIIRIKMDSEIKYDTIRVKQSEYGYIIEEKDNKAIALRLSGLNRPYFLRQFRDMAKARNLNEFQDAMKQLQLPLQNIIYADKGGDIFYLYNGIIPKRPQGNLQEWSQIIPASKNGALVNEYIAYKDLPKFKNPRSGFVANSNNGPWTSTYPFELDPKNYPEYITEEPFQYFNYRSVQSIKMILSEDKLSFGKIIDLQSSTHAELADRTVDELVLYGEQSTIPLLNQAAKVLKNWDRKFDTNSKGAVLFINWYNASRATTVFKVSFSKDDPLNTPHTITTEAKEAFLTAANKTNDDHESLDVPWGDVYHINYGKHSFKGGLGLSEVGSFNAGFYRPSSKTTYTLLGGSAHTSVVEFGSKIKAKGILSYGNASQPNSPFNGDQIQLLLDRKLRDIYFYQDDIDAHLYLHEVLKN